MKTTILLCCMILSGLLVQSQERRTPATQAPSEPYVFSQEVQRTFAMMHVAGAFENREHTNVMIERMGQLYGLTPPTTYRSDLRYVETMTVQREEGELVLRAGIRFVGFVARRDSRGFDFSDFLYPDRMNFRVQLLDAAGHTLYEEVMSGVALSPGRDESIGFQVVNLRIPDEYPSEGLALRLIEVVSPRPMLLFYHSSGQHHRFLEHMRLVEEYEGDAVVVEDRVKRMRAVVPDNPDHLASQLDLIEKYKGEVDQVLLKEWRRRLPLQEVDPAGLLASLEAFAGVYHEKKEAIQQGLRTLDEAWYQRGMEALRRNNEVLAMEWFEKAVAFNPVHVKSHYQIALVEFRKGMYDEAVARANRILSTMSPDRSLSADIHRLLTQIQDIQSKEYRDEYEKRVVAAEGEYSRGRVTEALQALMGATRYREENALYISDNGRAQGVAERILRGMTEDAERDFRAGRHEDAIRKYREAIARFTAHAPGLVDLIPLEGRIREIGEAVATQMAEEAKAAMRRGDYDRTETIITRLMEATQQPGSTTPSVTVNTLVNDYRTELYRQGQLLLSEGSYARAFELLGQALAAGQKYGLTPPADLYRLIDEARNGVFRDMILSGEQALNKRDFVAAEFYLTEALQFLQNRPAGESKVALERFITTLMGAFTDEGNKFLAVRDYDKALEYFDRGISLQRSFGVTDMRLGDLRLQALEGIGIRMLNGSETLLNQRNYVEALKSLKGALTFMEEHGLAGHSRGKLVQVADQYFRDALQRIDQLNRGRSYEEALVVLEDARYLCNHFPIRCDGDILDQRERDSRQAMFNGMVQQADRVLGRGDLAQAGRLMDEAEAYRTEWAPFVTETRESGQVAGRIRQRHYQQAVTTGKSLLDMKDHRQALTYFDEAFRLEEQGGFTFDSKLREYRRTAALQTLLSEADQLERMLGEASFMATKDKLLQILTMRTRYDLQDHKVLDGRLQSLQSRMVSAACLQQQSLFSEQVQLGREMERELKFIAAGEAYRRAVTAAAEHPECGLSDTLAQRSMERITTAIRYQELIIRSEEMLKVYKNAEALTAYLEAERLFNTGQLSPLGLTHEPFASHVLQQNLNYILSAAYYYLEQEDLRSALRMIDALAARGYPPAQTRLLQEQIGFRLGKEDAAKFPGSKWKTSVQQHTGGSKFYRHFSKAYKKGWSSK
jgi:tetratricopeptide (TPR) repeat protein